MSQIKASDTKPSVQLDLKTSGNMQTGKTLKQLTGDATNVYVPFLTDFVAANQI